MASTGFNIAFGKMAVRKINRIRAFSLLIMLSTSLHAQSQDWRYPSNRPVVTSARLQAPTTVDSPAIETPPASRATPDLKDTFIRRFRQWTSPLLGSGSPLSQPPAPTPPETENAPAPLASPPSIDIPESVQTLDAPPAPPPQRRFENEAPSEPFPPSFQPPQPSFSPPVFLPQPPAPQVSAPQVSAPQFSAPPSEESRLSVGQSFLYGHAGPLPSAYSTTHDLYRTPDYARNLWSGYELEQARCRWIKSYHLDQRFRCLTKGACGEACSKPH